jgi:hypothetical protein
MSAQPCPQPDPRLVVTIATQGGRLDALLRAYLAGRGREVFTVGDAGAAQAMIADHDHPASRAEMLRFVHRSGRPVIVLAARDPGLAGTVWVRKPLHFEALADAAEAVWSMLATPPTVRPRALQLLPPAASPVRGQPAPGAMRRVAAGPYRTMGRDDWTAKIAWMACGALGIAALASLLGWQPGVQGFREPQPRALAPAFDSRTLKQAVQAALKDAPPRSTLGQRPPTPQPVPADEQAAAQAVLRMLMSTTTVATPSNRALPLELMVDAPGGRADREQVLRRTIEAAVNRSLGQPSSAVQR